MDLTETSPPQLHPAMYQKSEPAECLLCPHNCQLKEGQWGICRTRVNQGGVIQTSAWDNLCSICIDPIEKKPLYHFLPGSRTLSIAIAGCNMRCLNCQNCSISQHPPHELPSYRLSAKDVIKMAVMHKVKSISFTYSEPTVFYEYMLETAKLAHKRGLKTILVSNGYINPEPLEELIPHIDAANIDLKSFDPEMHLKLTGARLEPVLQTVKALKEAGIWLEITHLIVPGYSDNIDVFRKMCRWLVNNGMGYTPLHISRFFPKHKLEETEPTPRRTMEDAYMTAYQCGIQRVYLGNMQSDLLENQSNKTHGKGTE